MLRRPSHFFPIIFGNLYKKIATSGRRLNAVLYENKSENTITIIIIIFFLIVLNNIMRDTCF